MAPAAYAVPPNAGDDSDSTSEDTPVTTDVLLNDSDPDIGDVLSVAIQMDVPTTNGLVSCTSALT